MKNAERLLLASEIKNVFDNGEKLFSTYFVCYFVKNKSDSFKYLVIASKKVGNAVARHRAKRICRVALKEVAAELSRAGISDIILISKKRILELKSNELREALLKKIK